MPVDVLYKTTARATGGRDGRSGTLDGKVDVEMSTPKELGGGGGDGVNPEQLFATGYSACFLGAMKFVSSQGGPKVPEGTTVSTTVGIGPRSEGGFGLTIAVEVDLPGLDKDKAEKLVADAEKICPYANATRGNVATEYKVV